jgi:hypothetical protein
LFLFKFLLFYQEKTEKPSLGTYIYIERENLFSHVPFLLETKRESNEILWLHEFVKVANFSQALEAQQPHWATDNTRFEYLVTTKYKSCLVFSETQNNYNLQN